VARPTTGYRNAAGVRVPGTTTIIGRFKDSGGLLRWAFAQGQAAERGEIRDLYDKRDEAAECGTLAHDCVEAHIHSEPLPSLPDTETGRKARQAFEMYLSWAKMTRLEIIATEMPLVSEQYQYGGTPDAIGTLGGELFLLDWKTSNGVYPDYIIQLAAYRQLVIECTDYDIGPGGHILRFAKSDADFAHHYFGDISDGWEQFALFRQAYEISKRLKRRV